MYSVYSRKNGTIKRLVFKCPHCDGEDPTECIAKRHYIVCGRCGKDYSPRLHEKCNWCKEWPASCDHAGSMKWLEDSWVLAGGKPTEAIKDNSDAGSCPFIPAREYVGEYIVDSVSKNDDKYQESMDV